MRTKNDAGQDVGVMHACGHDVHMTALLATAKVMTQTKDRWRGPLVMIGQPAKETIDGARAMLRDGLYERFPRPDYALALHVGAVDPAKVAESKRTGTPLPSLHSAVLAPVPEPTIRTGVRAMSAALLDLMRVP